MSDAYGELLTRVRSAAGEFTDLSADREPEVERLEALFGASFPADYRSFLLEVGHALVNGWELAGVHADGRNSDVYDASLDLINEQMREDAPALARHVAFTTDGGGNYFVLLRDGSGACAGVAEFDHEVGYEACQRWDGFAEFLADVMQGV